MKCRWCPYVAVESVKADGKPRTLFDDLKWHVSRSHPKEWATFTRQQWYDKMQSGRRIQAIRREEERFTDVESSPHDLSIARRGPLRGAS